MKKSLLLIAVMLISFIAATAQSCLPEGIIFSTQEQIDNFQTNYPDPWEVGLFFCDQIQEIIENQRCLYPRHQLSNA